MTEQRDRLRRYVLMSLGWPMVVFGIVTFPLPLVPSTTIAVIGLLLLSQVHPWARAIVVRARRRWRPLNRAYGYARRRLHDWQGRAAAATAAPRTTARVAPCLPAPVSFSDERGRFSGE
jgi:uncharacterized membrane protein YbaN (DUF454 family)